MKILSSIISPYQTTFLPGRLIQENTILVQEIFHHLKKKKGKKGLMAIKIDMEKAFDYIEWPFFLSIFEHLGYNHKWINWMKECITTVTYSININGSPIGFIHPKRGIHQSDPLSPFLFIMGSEVLSRLTNHSRGAQQ